MKLFVTVDVMAKRDIVVEDLFVYVRFFRIVRFISNWLYTSFLFTCCIYLCEWFENDELG